MQRFGFTGRLALWSARHASNVALGWVALLAVTLVLAALFGGQFRTDYEFTNEQESQRARDALRDLRGGDPLTEIILVRSESHRATDEPFRQRVTEIVRDLRAQPEAIVARKTLSYLDLPNGGGLVSADGRSALISTELSGELNESEARLAVLHEVLAKYDGRDGYTVQAGGVASVSQALTRAAEDDLATELKVLPVALLVLVVVFGAVVTALVPLGVAFIAIGVTLGIVTLLSNAWELSIFATNVITGIGLAVGIDYVLFIVARYREQRRLGQSEAEAMGFAGDTAARAVLFSGATVVVALLGMLIVPTTIFRSFAIGAIAVVVVAVAASLTLLPAVLALLGPRLNALALPWSRGMDLPSSTRGFWAWIARFVMWRAPKMALYSSIFLLLLTLPWLTLQLGASGAGAIPERFEARQVFDVVNREFSGGLLAPTTIVVTAPNVGVPDVAQSIGKLQIALESDPQIRQIAPLELSPRADIAVLTVALPGDGTSEEALRALDRLRTRVIPAAFLGSEAQVSVGGFTAINADFFQIVRDYTPLVFAFVLGLSFVLLLLIFRSIVVPLKSIVMNLLSVGAAYGVVTAVFQHGWGAEWLGFQQTPRIEAWVPLFMFTILFGLSMDYHIFLLSRIRERFDETGNNEESVAFGLRSTANIITGAAVIMVVVFGGFALGDLAMMQQMGVGLGVSVFLDATVVRIILVPATMKLLGDRNWYLPPWLEWLPDLRVERQPDRTHPARRVLRDS
jgi:uncharacterized membrane protein YdfJ with MMPL/SSD domain